ncbi:recombinase family protein [Mycolicibacterium sphagni]|uniref:Resolvase/invertase-type recombinase catalytic domain-containing protein n=1 Tax=Mycolicibacterium sphagni TaxID=1786 RepID=A0A255D8B1_9MYCO|nr:hypothetical protein CG716_24960 [Mycolicibacterium sphagni]
MQLSASEEAGAERIWEDQVSGMRNDRPDLTCLRGYVCRGDALMNWLLDRLNRSREHLLTLVGSLRGAGVKLRSFTESADTTTPGVRRTFHVFGGVDEFARTIATEATATEVANTCVAGRHLGRPGLGSDTIAAHAIDQAGTIRARIAPTVGISRSGVNRCLERAA